MKKTLKFCALTLLGITALTGCGEGKPTKTLNSIEIVDNSIATKYFLNEEVNYSKLSAKLTYSDNTSSTLLVKDFLDSTKETYFTYTEIKTDVVNDSLPFTLTYHFKENDEAKTLEDEIKIQIVEKTAEDYEISELKVPDIFTNYSLNKKDFKVQDSAYRIGSFNEIDLYPNVIAYDDNLKPFNLKGKKLGVTIEEFVEGSYKTLSEDELKNLVSFEHGEYIFKFNSTANNKQFKLTYSVPEDSDIAPISVEFVVVDAYNITDVNELSLYNNSTSSKEAKAVTARWEKYYEANKENPIVNKIASIDKTKINGFALHSSLNVYKEHLPEDCFFKEGEVTAPEVGSMKNSMKIYYRDITENDFNFYGNYFTIDVAGKKDASGQVIKGEEILAIRNENDKANWDESSNDLKIHADSRTGFFDVNNFAADENGTKYKFQDLKTVGNSKKSVSKRGSGGFCFFVAEGLNGKFDNIVSFNQYIPFKFEKFINTLDKLKNVTLPIKPEVTNCESRDSYQSAVYLYGSEVSIKNSDFITCGGPVIFGDAVLKCDYPNNTSMLRDFPAKIFVDKNSKLESFVTGEEAWFQGYNATGQVEQLKLLDQLFNAQHQKTFLKTNSAGKKEFNLITFYKNAGTNLLDLGSPDNPHYAFTVEDTPILDTDNAAFASLYQDPLKAVYYDNPVPLVMNTNESKELKVAAIYQNSNIAGIYDPMKLAMKLAQQKLPGNEDLDLANFKTNGYLSIAMKVKKTGWPLGFVLDNYTDYKA